MQTNQHAAENK